MINNEDFDPSELLFLNEIKIFQSIQVYNIRVQKEEDIYIKDKTKYDKPWPRLGLTSGPNISFFETVKQCSSFNTILMVETDCILKPNCFTVCKNYVGSMCDFLISGSKYLGGSINWSPSEMLFHHLNGVAFYKTGSSEFQSLMINVERFIALSVTQKVSMSYDVAVMAFVYDAIEANRSESEYYKRVESKLISNTFILNYSVDSDIKIDEIDSYFPSYVILHSKLNI